jgi:hypothetical protein
MPLETTGRKPTGTSDSNTEAKEEQETGLYIKWYRTIVVRWVLKDL